MHFFTCTENFKAPDFQLTRGASYLVEDVTAAELLFNGLGHAVWTPPLSGSQEIDWNHASLLIVRTGGIGDLLFLTPILTALRGRYPGIKLGVCAYRRYWSVLAEFSDVELVPYPLLESDARRFHGMAWMENAVEKEPRAREMHIVHALAARLPMPLEVEDLTLRYRVTEAEATAAMNRWPRTPGRRRIAVQIGASSRARSYPTELMARLIRLLWDTGAEIVLLGNPKECPDDQLPPRVINLTNANPPATLRESVAVLAGCDALVAPDSAMTHFAAALKVPCVALYGPFPWQIRTSPYPTTRAIMGRAPCAPCFHHARSRQFPEGKPCATLGHCVAMSSIEPERVVREVQKLLPAKIEVIPPRVATAEKALLRLPRVQLALLDGRGDPLALHVLTWLVRRFQFGSVVLISPGEHATWRLPRPLDYQEAMRFQGKKLGEALLSSGLDYQLSIECDGFPVHPHLWADEFLEWDYIGAPWPPEWVPPNGSRVGNGGCCLRSRRFIEALKPLTHPNGVTGDVWWCHDPEVRDAVARAGARYAPVDVALRFSFEAHIPEAPEWDHSKSFGFHRTLPGWKEMVQNDPLTAAL